MAMKLLLVPKCNKVLKDAAGNWLIEGGELYDARKKHVGYYSGTNRTSCGTRPQEVTQLWMTLMFLKDRPPQNMTLHGVQTLGSVAAIGSVSAASQQFAASIGKQFKRAGNVLTIA